MTIVNVAAALYTQASRPPAGRINQFDRLECNELVVGGGPRRVVIKVTPDWCGVQIDGEQGRHALMADIPSQHAVCIGTWGKRGWDNGACDAALISDVDGGKLQLYDEQRAPVFLDAKRSRWVASIHQWQHEGK